MNWSAMSFLRYARKRALAFSALLVMLGVLLVGCVPGTAVAGGGSAPVIDNGVLYIGSQQGELLAINPETGARLWSVSLLQPAPRNAFGCTSSPRPATIYGTPVVSDNLVYVGGYDGRLRVYNNGVEQARYPADEISAVGAIVGGPVLGRDSVYFGTAKGEVFALDATTLLKKWQFDADGRVWSSPLLSGDTLYFTSMDSHLYALDADSGTEKWRFEAGGAITSPPVLSGDSIYFGAFDRYFYAVNAQSGQLAWKSTIQAGRWFWAAPVVVGDAVYAGSMDNKVYIFDAKTGESLAVPVDLGAPLVAAPVLTGDSVLFAAENGKLWAIDTAQYQAKELQAAIAGKVNAALALSSGVIYIHTQSPDTLYVVRADSGVNKLSVPLGK